MLLKKEKITKNHKKSQKKRTKRILQRSQSIYQTYP